MLNQIIIHGRLTNDPSMQIKNTNNGSIVLPFSVACDRWNNGTKTTDFFDVIAWNNTASFIAKHFKKGSDIIIVGRLQARSYETQDGEKRKVCEIVVNSVEFVGGSKATQETTPQEPPQESTTEPHHEEPKKSFADTLRAAAIKPTPKVKSVAQFFDATPPPQEPPAQPEEQPDEPRGELPFEI